MKGTEEWVVGTPSDVVCLGLVALVALVALTGHEMCLFVTRLESSEDLFGGRGRRRHHGADVGLLQDVLELHGERTKIGQGKYH